LVLALVTPTGVLTDGLLLGRPLFSLNTPQDLIFFFSMRPPRRRMIK
jgi:hypothetical protein